MTPFEMPFRVLLFFVFQKKGFKKQFIIVLLFLIEYFKLKKQILKCF